jgi:hypothetical protein
MKRSAPDSMPRAGDGTLQRMGYEKAQIDMTVDRAQNIKSRGCQARLMSWGEDALEERRRGATSKRERATRR